MSTEVAVSDETSTSFSLINIFVIHNYVIPEESNNLPRMLPKIEEQNVIKKNIYDLLYHSTRAEISIHNGR